MTLASGHVTGTPGTLAQEDFCVFSNQRNRGGEISVSVYNLIFVNITLFCILVWL